ncbi:cholesterol 25-hydroxylase-like protein [Arapaima gigas]
MLLLQELWDCIRAHHEYLNSPFFPVLFSLTFYLSFCLYFMILDILSLFIFPVTVLHRYLRSDSYPTDVIACLLLFDFQYFLWHLVHHRVSWLYNAFHRVHHKYTSTSAFSTENTGGWETVCSGFFAAVNPVMLRCHPLTEMTFYVLNIWLSVEDHSGYDFPWSTQRLVPFGLYGGAVHHSIHHQKFTYNYAPYFTLWDRLFGTLYSPSRPPQL